VCEDGFLLSIYKKFSLTQVCILYWKVTFFGVEIDCHQAKIVIGKNIHHRVCIFVWDPKTLQTFYFSNKIVKCIYDRL
jgi:hypothetical protein